MLEPRQGFMQCGAHKLHKRSSPGDTTTKKIARTNPVAMKTNIMHEQICADILEPWHRLARGRRQHRRRDPMARHNACTHCGPRCAGHGAPRTGPARREQATTVGAPGPPQWDPSHRAPNTRRGLATRQVHNTSRCRLLATPNKRQRCQAASCVRLWATSRL